MAPPSPRFSWLSVHWRPLLGWSLVIWVVLFWSLGVPSFWDPDEAHYAQATREMLASRDWLVPTYNGQAFFDKPILFYLLQLVSFVIFGETEFAARLVPAVSALGLLAATYWLGRRWFDARTGSLGALMLALLPGTFALSSYAILDMTFTALLFSGVALIAEAALRNRPALQYWGYVLVALATLTKGPLALALPGVTFVGVLILIPEARRPFLALRWLLGLGMILALASPWFIYMSWRFGRTFIDWYFLHENLSLYSASVFGPAASPFYFVPVIAIGLLPWTPVLGGRLIDLLRGDRAPVEERLLWTWSLAVFAFFSLSHFKLDHYIYPVAPALCLLAARAWYQLRDAASIRPHAGVAIGTLAGGLALVAGGVVLIPKIRTLPLSMLPWADLVPAAFIAGGLTLIIRLARGRLRPPQLPYGVAGAWLVAYAVVIAVVLPEFERAKPVKDLAQWITAHAPPGTVGAYQLDRWNTSFRFYVQRPVEFFETPAQLVAFVQQPGRHVLMMRREFEQLRAAGHSLAVVFERTGIFTTTGRAIQRNGRNSWKSFVVVVGSQGTPAAGGQ